MGRLHQKLLEIGEFQHQLVTREDFLRIGTRRQLEYCVATKVLVRVHNSVYRLAAREQTWRQCVHAACLAGGRYSAASFRAAARLQELPGGEELVEVTFRRHSRAQYEGVIVHESRHLTERDLLLIDNIPVTNAARTLC